MSDPTPVRHQSRSSGPILLGLLEIGMGIACLPIFSFLHGKGVAQEPIYLLIPLFLVTMGVGTIRTWRWARTLMLVVSWGWLIHGVYLEISIILNLPRVSDRIELFGRSSSWPLLGTILGSVAAVLGLLLYVVPPGILLYFSYRPDVQAAFETKGLGIPWVDRIPLPVRILILFFSAVSIGALAGTKYAAFPDFGYILTGRPAILCWVGLGVISAFFAWAAYLRYPVAWRGALIGSTLGGVNGFFFLKQGGASLRDLVAAMGITSAQLVQMGIYDLLWIHPTVLALLALGWMAWLVFLISAKEFFTVEKTV